LSLPREIRMVPPVRIVNIGIWLKSQTGEICVHLIIWKFGVSSPGWTITRTVIRIGAIWTWFIWVTIVSAVDRSRCPTTRRNMLCRKIVIIIIRKIHASFSLFNMQISHIKHQPIFFIFFYFYFLRNRNNKNKLQINK
jgi:hypothetical protein